MRLNSHTSDNITATSDLQKIVLIGFMGSGKSSIASLLAKKLNFQHFDTDTMVLEHSTYKAIPEIFENDGEQSFRQLELTVASSLRFASDAVIATGGGVVMNQLTMDALKNNALVVYLKTDLSTVLDRIGDDSNRPLLRDKVSLNRLYTMRCALYEYYADWMIETDASSPEDIVEQMSAYLMTQRVLVSC